MAMLGNPGNRALVAPVAYDDGWAITFGQDADPMMLTGSKDEATALARDYLALRGGGILRVKRRDGLVMLSRVPGRPTAR
jgi:hypothetical protein